jgi:hypothetical protein
LRKTCVWIVLLFGVPTVGWAQEYPRGEVFVGYSYLRIDDGGVNTIAPNIFTINRGLNGWEASASFNLTPWLALKADGSGHYGDLINFNAAQANMFHIDNFQASVQSYSFLGGPVLAYRRPRYKPFVHALFGGRAVRDEVTINIPGIELLHTTTVGTQFAMAFGGGLDVRITSRLSARIVQADYMLSNHLEAGGNLRASAGIVFEFGGPRSDRSKNNAPSASSGVLFPALGIRGNEAAGRGVLIVEVLAGGAGESSGLRVGDIIDSLDGTPVTAPGDLLAQLSSRASATSVRLGVMARGLWQTETTVLLSASR